MEGASLTLIVVLLAATVLAVALMRRARMPAIMAYLLTGLLIGPHGLGWIPDTTEGRLLAEFGVVFLLFTLGLEFSLPKLVAMKREVLVLGGAQVLATLGVAPLVGPLMGWPPEVAVVLASAFAMSSTAIVIKQLAEQTELNLQHGRLAVGVLLFQDLAFIPLLILVPALGAHVAGSVTAEIVWALAKGVLAFATVMALGRWLLRPLFHHVAAAESAELFTLTVLLATLGCAAITHALGLSAALGAFLAGMLLGETEFRHQIEADIRPFRDVLLGLFFVTIGMLLNPAAVVAHWPLVLALVIGVVLFKAASIGVLARLLVADPHIATRAGIVLAQGGEFGFALITLALASGVLDRELAQTALAANVLSMLLCPVLIRNNASLAARLFPASEAGLRDLVQHDVEAQQLHHERHVIIVGFGRVGQNVARFLEQENVDYVALDLDPVRIQAARAAGDPVYYGDATNIGVLRAAGVERARVLIVTYYQVATSLKVLAIVRKLRPDLPVLVRTRDDSRLEELMQAGATEVIPETLEASLMVASHLLLLLNVPMGRVVRRMNEVRTNRYGLLRSVFRGQDARPIDETHAFREQLGTIAIDKGARAIGRAIGDLGLDDAGVSVTGLRREGIVGRQPAPDTVLREGDVLVLYGKPEDLERAEELVLGG
jgi:CPA2 family monovalent cation:H+ antiporter-2